LSDNSDVWLQLITLKESSTDAGRAVEVVSLNTENTKKLNEILMIITQ
jgi:hypothetical protein